jgi:hypothetical protein
VRRGSPRRASTKVRENCHGSNELLSQLSQSQMDQYHHHFKHVFAKEGFTSYEQLFAGSTV